MSNNCVNSVDSQDNYNNNWPILSEACLNTKTWLGECMWKPCFGFNKYEINSETSEIRNIKTGKIRSPTNIGGLY